MPRMLLLPLRFLRHRPERTAVAALTAFALAILAAVSTPACAQEWDPFSQLESNRWEQRSKQSVRKLPDLPQAPASDAPASTIVTQAPGRDPPGSYLDPPPGRQPRFEDEPRQTYYPPSSTGQPNAGRARPGPPGNSGYGTPENGTFRAVAPSRNTASPTPTGPSSVRMESLAPLPDSEAPAGPGLSGGSVGHDPGPDVAVRQREVSPNDNAGGGLAPPDELWRGLDAEGIENLIATLEIPPRSPALHNLWRRLLMPDATAPSEGRSDMRFLAIRLEALYRSGLLGAIRETLAANRNAATDPLMAMLEARSEIGLGHRDAGCEAIKRMHSIKGEIPRSLRGEAILVSGYCAAASGNKPAAGLLAELAREEGIKPSPGLAALDAVGLGVKTDISLTPGQKLSLIDYRILELAGATPPADELVKSAAPALLVAIASDSAANVDLRLAAGEAAARINAFEPVALADLYRSTAGKMNMAAAPLETSNNGTDTPSRRALLFASAEAEHTPFKKVRLIRAYIDSAKRAGLYLPSLTITARLTDQIGLVPEIGWFAETAIEANLAAANYQNARKWANFAASVGNDRGQSMAHWNALIDISDPHFPDERGKSLASLERLALVGRFTSESLHRLATVLDALEYNVPIPLWEAASRTPQPATGHLPETGVLTELQDAAKKREYGRTVLLVMKTLGPDGADHAHMIALGDAIRALKRAGHEPDARRLGFEALLAGWPQVLAN